VRKRFLVRDEALDVVYCMTPSIKPWLLAQSDGVPIAQDDIIIVGQPGLCERLFDHRIIGLPVPEPVAFRNPDQVGENVDCARVERRPSF
jgi:hypothetical protein